MNTEELYCLQLRKSMSAYSEISEESWKCFSAELSFYYFGKGEIILRAGQTAKNIYFLCKGVVRTFYTDSEGATYTKNIFLENSFPASKSSLILQAPSNFSIQALEDVIMIGFNFHTFKKLMEEKEEFKNYYIAYLEKNWVVVKEKIEISLVMETAKERYLKLIQKHPSLESRISQHHIASHLGITPTQLSRIRKTLQKK